MLTYSTVFPPAKRRKKTEKKAKVVTSASGKEFIQLLATLAVLHWDDIEE